MESIYLCIDLKTFYASVECVERGWDPLLTNLVVADPTRGQGAICLAISPPLKKLGIHNRCRIFDIPKRVEYYIAMPRMKLYMQYSADIYAIYLKYISPQDIHVYSIDEVFLDATHYLSLYQLSKEQLAQKIIDDIYKTYGITATVGIGTNLYLAKIALDISAKHDDSHMAYLDEKIYCEKLWHHRPIADFWQVGRGISRRLAKHQLFDMYDVAHCDEKILYKEFGINAEYLRDHAWGKEPTTIADIKNYHTQSHSLSNNQILFEDYCYEDALLAVKEMVELHVLELVEKHLVTNGIFLSVGYSKHVIRSTKGSMKLSTTTNSYQIILEAFIHLFKKTTNPHYPIRRLAVGFMNVVDEIYESYDLFTDYEALEKEKNLQKALIDIKQKYGKSAVLKGMNMFEKSTTRKRNKLVGGHNAE